MNRREVLSRLELEHQKDAEAARNRDTSSSAGAHMHLRSSAGGSARQGDAEWHLTIATIDGGYTAGQTFIYRLSEQEGDTWHSRILAAVKSAKRKERERYVCTLCVCVCVCMHMYACISRCVCIHVS